MTEIIRRIAAVTCFAAVIGLHATSANAEICVGDKCPSRGQTTSVFQQSPVTAGFWSWPRTKPKDAAEIAAACRDTIAMVLANGRYLGIHFTKSSDAGRTLYSAKLVDRGACKFDAATQIEKCDLIVPGIPGETSSGTIATRYTAESDGALKGSVEATTLEGPNKGKAAPFDIYPVRCPDDVVHDMMLMVLPTP